MGEQPLACPCKTVAARKVGVDVYQQKSISVVVLKGEPILAAARTFNCVL